MAMKAVKALITGRVLGVNFRSIMQRNATRLELTGFVRAMPNRTLEVFAEGPEENLEEFVKFIVNGPKRAEIEETDIEWKEYAGKSNRFTIRYGPDEDD